MNRNMPTPHRSRVLSVAVLAIIAMTAVSCSSPTPNASPSDAGGSSPISGEIVWADFGGPTNEARQEAYFDGFEAETGVRVISATLQDAVLLSMLDGEDGEYDSMQGDAALYSTQAENLIEIPESAQGDLLPAAMRPHVLGGFVFGIAQAWLSETYADGGPQDWADFFDVKKFPGKRAWPGAAGSFDASYEIALIADGVSIEELYPLDVERAQAKLDTIREDLVFYTAYPEVQQLLVSGSVAIAVTVNGQFTALMNQGVDVTVQWNQAFVVPTGFGIPIKASNPAATAALAEWMNDPERQAAFTEATNYGPSNSAVFDYLSDEVANNLVNAPQHADIVLEWDNEWRGENYEMLLNSYTEWLAG
ncbi:extracellular solute-binding protein [Microbacterium sp. A204]|uniref:extracellular solute-binding protein n=1 Tax=Microbacterium sp. A204 TaxID=3457321 RepID=UPI003FD4C0D0